MTKREKFKDIKKTLQSQDSSFAAKWVLNLSLHCQELENLIDKIDTALWQFKRKEKG